MKNMLGLLVFLGFATSLSAQVDTVPPTLICKNSITANLFSGTGLIGLFAGSDFYDTLYDDVSSKIELGIRKVCMSTGFPTDTFVLYAAQGSYAIDLWARDEAGNGSSCRVKVEITDIWGLVHPYPNIYTRTATWVALPEVQIDLRSNHCYYDSINLLRKTDHDGYLYFNRTPEPGANMTITPTKNDNPLNGITTYDLVLISKHILGIEALDSPHKLIAADANLDGKVTTADVVLLRKLILGINQEFPHGKSWRFIRQDYVIPNPQDPFNPPFPEDFANPFVSDLDYHSYYFIGMKIGDVNNTAIPGN